jgi:hypothetical protein
MPYKLPKLEFSTTLIKLISAILSQREVSVSVDGEISASRKTQAGVPQCSVLSPTLYNMYINDALQTPGVHLALFADDICLYAKARKVGSVV